MEEVLVTSSFPRSGSVYLNQALNLLYYPNKTPNTQLHTISSITKLTKVLVPFRNPMDAIPSWNIFMNMYSIESDVKFYIRFYSAVLDNLNKVVLMDFDYFTKDLDYIKDKVSKNFGIETDRSITDTQVKEAMLAGNKDINLPRNNQEELNAVKEQLANQPLFEKCVELFNELKTK